MQLDAGIVFIALVPCASLCLFVFWLYLSELITIKPLLKQPTAHEVT